MARVCVCVCVCMLLQERGFVQFVSMSFLQYVCTRSRPNGQGAALQGV